MASSDSETVYEGRAGGELLPNQKLGPYEIQRKIGSGGMGVVYLANDSRLKRPVALKILPPDKALNPILVRRFRSEAEKVAQLRHENIVAIYDTGEVNGYSYMAMEYIEGTDLQKLLDVRKRIPFRRSLDIVKQVTRALAHANAISIVHRDIKPANLLIKRDGTVKLTDMGLARTMDDSPESGITRAGTTVGTIDYMSPEQARDSKSADTRSDLYSLGCTWYQMLTGEPPYPEGSLTNKLRAHAYSPIPDPRNLNPEVPEPIVAVVQRMMSKNPDDRYQSPDKLLDDLDNPHLLLEDVGQKIFAELEDEKTPPVRSNAAAELNNPAVIDREARPSDQNRKAKTGAQPAIEKGVSSTQKPGSGTKSPSQRVLSRHERESQDAGGLIWRMILGSAAILLVGIAYFGATTAWPKIQQYVFPATGRNQSNPLDERRAEHIPAADPIVQGKPAEAQAATPVKPPEKNAAANPSSPKSPEGTSAPAATTGPSLPAGLSQLDSVPQWIHQSIPTTGLRVVSVGPGASTELRYATINAAINALPGEGGVIEIAGDGPFPIAPTQISKKTVILRGASGTRPFVQFVAASQDHNTAFLTVSNGLLQLQGVDLAVEGSSLKGTSLTHLLAIENSDLYLIDSSINLLGSPEKPVTAVRFQGIPKRDNGNSSPAILLGQRLMIRGRGLSGLEILSPHIDLVLRESLLTLADGDLIRVTPQSGTKDQTIALRILESTLSSGGAGFHLIAPEKGTPGSLGILVQNSLLSAPGSNHSALLIVENWPKSLEAGGSLSPLSGMVWMVKKSTLLGWKHLQKMIPEDTLSTNSAEEWKKLWKQSPAEEEILSANWPSVPEAYSPLQPASLWSRESLSNLSKETGRGCNVAALPTRPAADWNLIAKTTHRPVWETAFPATGETVSIDANRTDVGRRIAEREWPDGTTFKISGSGLRTSSPFTVKNRRLRLIFEGGGDAPLTISPRSNDFREKGSNSEQAFISVDNGSLEIIGGKFSVSPNDRQHPDWFLKVEQGSFSLNKTQLESPMTREFPLKGWIKWSGGTATKETQSLISDCFLTGGGVLIDVTLNKRSLLVRNSLLVSRDDVFLLQGAVRSGSIESGALDLERCTLAAGGAFFRLNWPQSGQGKNLNIFADSCLYLPSLQDPQKPLQPALFANPEPMSLARVNWVETRCGYATEITNYLTGWPIKEATLKTIGDWCKQWGEESVRQPLSNPGDIQLTESGGPRGLRMKLSQYQLKPQAQAASWGIGRLPIGVDVKKLESATTSSSATNNDSSRSTPAAPTNPTKPLKAQKSPGF